MSVKQYIKMVARKTPIPRNHRIRLVVPPICFKLNDSIIIEINHFNVKSQGIIPIQKNFILDSNEKIDYYFSAEKIRSFYL